MLLTGSFCFVKDLLAVPGKADTNPNSRISVDRHYVKQVLDTLTSVEVLEMTDWSTVLREPKCVQW